MSWRIRGVVAAAGAFALFAGGCASIPPLDNPVAVRPGVTVENPTPTTDAATPEGYAEVYERVLDAMDDYFDLVPGSRYAGVVRTYPRVAPGYEQPWKPGSPSSYERWLATFQTIRHTAVARIEAGEGGGFRVYVEVYKEQENLGQPILAASSSAAFRDAGGISRQAELVSGPSGAGGQWFAAGSAPHRDFAFEQAILRKVQRPATLK